MKTEELFKECLIRNASAFGGDLAYVRFQHRSVKECWAAPAVVHVLADRNMGGCFEADGPKANPPCRQDRAPRRVDRVLAKGDNLSIVTIFLEAPADINPCWRGRAGRRLWAARAGRDATDATVS